MSSKRQDMGREIVQFEGRFDKAGNLVVYELPAGDGGGSHEVAGINSRYHPEALLRIAALVNSGQHARARVEAQNYILEQTDCVLLFFPSTGGLPETEAADRHPHIEFLLRDSAWNRGCKGAATILQLALGMDQIDGLVGRQTKSEFGMQLSEDSNALAKRITEAREIYERNVYPWKQNKRDETSKFWKGLENRWAKAHMTSTTFV